MKLSIELGEQILSRARQLLDKEVLVANTSGVVVAGTNYQDQIVVDALRACQEGRVVRAQLGTAPIVWCPFVYQNQTAGAFGIFEIEAQVTPEAISLLQGLAEVITHQNFLIDRIQPSEKIRGNFIQSLLTSSGLDAEEAYRQADILQLNLRQPQAIILAEVAGFETTVAANNPNLSLDEKEVKIAEAASESSRHILAAFRNHPGNTACYLGQNLFVLSKGIGGDQLNLRNTMRFLLEKAEFIHDKLRTKLPDTPITIGVGQYYPDLGGLRKSYQEAKLSLNVGGKVWGPGRVYHIKQVGMYITLANVPAERKAELAHQILFPLLSDEQLYKTVQNFLGSGLNLTDTAAKLHVHRNTLIYRLDKIKKMIGLDPRVFEDALQIKLGLMFYQGQPVS